MPKIVDAALKAKAKYWTFEAKTKATGPEVKAIKNWPQDTLAWPRGLHHCIVCMPRDVCATRTLCHR